MQSQESNQAPPTRCIQPVVAAGIFYLFFVVAGINDAQEAKVAFSSPPSVPGRAVWKELGKRFPTASLTDEIAPLLCGQYFPLKLSKCCHFLIANRSISASPDASIARQIAELNHLNCSR